MECLSDKSIIQNIFSNIRVLSYKEKKSPLIGEKATDQLLDAILGFKEILNKKTEAIYGINESIERLTWFNDLDEEHLILLNDIISSAKDLASSLSKQYVLMAPIKSKNIAKQEIKDFKNAIDELKEAHEDLESVFFILPNNPEFTEVTEELSRI